MVLLVSRSCKLKIISETFLKIMKIDFSRLENMFLIFITSLKFLKVCLKSSILFTGLQIQNHHPSICINDINIQYFAFTLYE